jgi:hypothetical protein
MSRVPNNSGFEPQAIRGEGGILVSGAGNVVVTSNGIVPATPFQFIDVPAAALTGTFAFVDLMTASATFDRPGGLLLDFDAPVEITPPAASGVPEGLSFQFVVDGTPISSAAIELDFSVPFSGIDTFTEIVRMRAFLPVAAGAHSIAVQWQLINAISTANTFGSGNGHLSIENPRGT